MRRGTTLDGFLDRGDEMQQRERGYNSGNVDAGFTEKWHAFVEEECTKRYFDPKMMLTQVSLIWHSSSTVSTP
jgi:hypothetical protein